MHVVVVGASGNVGTSVLRALADEAAVDSVLGLARRRPQAEFAKTTWATADVTADDLTPHFRGADAVVHLAWAIQPSRDDAELRRINVRGGERRRSYAAGVYRWSRTSRACASRRCIRWTSAMPTAARS